MPFSLLEVRAAWVWTWLVLATVAVAGLLALARISAAVLIGSMLAAIAISSADGKISVPLWPYRIAQAFVGCLIARSLNVGNLHTIVARWPTFLLCVSTVIAISVALGGLLARWRVLPGTTAVWGSAPGAATVMTLLGEAYGADVRLVAFMQFLRVAVVAFVASLVSRLWAPHAALPAHDWFPALAATPFAVTTGVALLGAVSSAFLNVPGGPLLLPMLAMAVLAGGFDFPICLPPWLLALSYALLGWAIGLRFTREILRYTASAFFKVLASILTLVALCGGLGYLLHRATGIDPLSAYLATSPGGADSVAIIAASSAVDLPFVTALQTCRFLLVLVAGPALARFTARWSQRGAPPTPE